MYIIIIAIHGVIIIIMIIIILPWTILSMVLQQFGRLRFDRTLGHGLVQVGMTQKVFACIYKPPEQNPISVTGQ